MKENKSRFPENEKFLRKFMEKKKIKQSELGELLGYKKATFNAVFRGRTEIGVAFLRKLFPQSGMSKRSFMEHFSESFKL